MDPYPQEKAARPSRVGNSTKKNPDEEEIDIPVEAIGLFNRFGMIYTQLLDEKITHKLKYCYGTHKNNLESYSACLQKDLAKDKMLRDRLVYSGHFYKVKLQQCAKSSSAGSCTEKTKQVFQKMLDDLRAQLKS